MRSFMLGIVLVIGLGPPVSAGDQNPRALRAAREQAVEMLGDESRDFVEVYAEDAVAAIGACSQEVGMQMVEFYNSGGWEKFPRPRQLLRVISDPNHGDEVATWAMAHEKELENADNFDAYMLEPLSYAMDLKKLEAGAEGVRKWRRFMEERKARIVEWEAQSAFRTKLFILGGAITVAGGMLVWRFRQSGY